jgi:hypothetical protein
MEGWMDGWMKSENVRKNETKAENGKKRKGRE